MKAYNFFWPRTESIPPLSANQVHVWAWNLDLAPLPHDWKILSEAETIRARRFVFPRDRDRYVRAHSAMRSLLGAYLGLSPAEIALSTNAYGKPQIEPGNDTQRIRFNLTHSAGIAALAVSRDYELGIDMERIRPIDADVAEHHFSSRELLTLRTLPPEQWLPGFYRCWTSKEALLKGEGLGLNLPLDGFDVEVHPQLPAALLDLRPQAPIAAGWLLVELNPAEDIVATLALRDETGKFDRSSLRCFALVR